MSSNGEAACSYALLILIEEGIPVTAEKIKKLLEAANVTTESYWPMLFAKLADKRNLDDLILNVGFSGAASAAGPSGATASAPASAVAAVEEEKKEEDAKDAFNEEDDDCMFSLFDD